MSDDYSKMMIFNPYLQMAMGIMAGNSGRSKSEAFANAMGGGLSAAQNAQEAQRQQAQQVLLQQKAAREQQQYDYEMLQQQNIRDWATAQMKNDPANAETYALIAQNPEFGVKWFKTSKDVENDAARTAAYKMGVLSSGRGGGGGSDKPNPWSYKDMSDSDYKNIDAEMSVQHGDAWDKLDPKQKRATAMQIYAQRMYEADRGYAPGPSNVQLPQPPPSLMDRAVAKFNEWRGEPAAPKSTGEVVTDSTGRKWEYKGSGDRSDKKNYREVK